MKNCAICSTELKFINSPSFGAGNLNDGAICSKCFKKLSKIDNKIVYKLKKHSTSDINNILSNRIISNKEVPIINQNTKLDKIKNDIKKLNLINPSSFLGRKEIKELPNILAENEEIEYILLGFYNNGTGLLITTNIRLLFIDKGMLYGIKVENFPLEKISSIQYETGLVFGKVKIYTSGNVATIENLTKKEASSFTKFMQSKLLNAKQKDNAKPTQTILEQLKTLGKLKNTGILTESEFNEQKEKLLNKL